MQFKQKSGPQIDEVFMDFYTEQNPELSSLPVRIRFNSKNEIIALFRHEDRLANPDISPLAAQTHLRAAAAAAKAFIKDNDFSSFSATPYNLNDLDAIVGISKPSPPAAKSPKI